MNQLVLSLFPGVGLLDRAFEQSGFCVVRGPDRIHGGDVRNWTPPAARRIDGIIAGPPCQGFSCANSQRHDPSHPSVIQSRELLQWTVRTIERCEPTWALIENVPGVPDVRIAGYTIQRIAINDFECGGRQLRWRAIQFAHRDGFILRPMRVNDRSESRRIGRRPDAITTKPDSRHRTFAEQCRRQGLAEPLELAGWTREAKFRAVGNGVPLSVGRVLAAAVLECVAPDAGRVVAAAVRECETTADRETSSPAKRVGPAGEFDCRCGCGRAVAGGNHRAASAACRKRLQLQRERARPVVDRDGYRETVAKSAIVKSGFTVAQTRVGPGS